MQVAIDAISKQNDGLQKAVDELELRLIRPSNMPTGSLRRRIAALRDKITANLKRIDELCQPAIQ
jgi:hypothetical protein